MAVNNEKPIANGTGGVTHYDFAFRVIEAADLQVLIDGVLQTTGYTVTLNGDAGGSVDFATATPAASHIMLRRATPFTRGTDYQDNGDLLAQTIDDDFDRLWLALQEEQAASDQTLNKPLGQSAWNAEGFQIENLADGIADTDAATVRQVKTLNGGAQNSATAAAGSATAAAGSALAAAGSATAAAGSAAAAKTSETNAAASAAAALLSETNAETSEQNATVRAQEAAGGATAAATSEGNAKTSADDAAASALEAARYNPNRCLLITGNLADVDDKAAAVRNLMGTRPLTLGAEGVGSMDAVTVGQFQRATSGTGATMNGVMNNFIGAVEWFNGGRDNLPAGYIAADGQLIDRTAEPDLWEAVRSGFLNSVPNSVWCGNETTGPNDYFKYRGMYALGLKADNTTDGTADDGETFRVPDLNGAKVKGVGGWGYGSSFSALHLRGDTFGNAGAVDAGTVLRNGAPDIHGNFDLRYSVSSGGVSTTAIIGAGGAIRNTGLTTGQNAEPLLFSNKGTTSFQRISFDASNSAAAYGRDNTTEVRPNSAAGIWIIRASGAFEAANSTFSVITADATKPPAGEIHSGGFIVSDYKVAGTTLSSATFGIRKTLGGAGLPRVSSIDFEADPANPVNTAWDFPATGGTLVTSEASGWGATKARQMVDDTGAPTADANALRINGLYVGPGDTGVNFPPTMNGKYGPLLHMARYEIGTVAQLSFSDAGGMAVRGGTNGGATWGSWYRVAYSNAANLFNQTQSHGVTNGECIRIVAANSTPGYIVCRTGDSTSTNARWQLGNPAANNDVSLSNNMVSSGVWFTATGSVTLRAKSAPNATNRDLIINQSGQVNHPAGGTIASTTSDISLKTNIKDAATGALDRINRMRPREFNWKEHGDFSRGFIAQELEAIDPVYVKRYDENGYVTADAQRVAIVEDRAIIADLIGAIQELKAEIEALKNA